MKTVDPPGKNMRERERLELISKGKQWVLWRSAHDLVVTSPR